MRRRANAGFTLVEILVVLVIISIVTAIGVLSLGSLGRNPQAENTAQKLAAITNLVAQQAVMRGQQYGLRVSPHAYEFMSYDGRKWSSVSGDDLLRPRRLDSGVSLSLQLQGTQISLPAPAASNTNPPAADDASPADNRPQILLLSSGEITPFRITVSGVNTTNPYLVTGDLQHGIRVISPDDHHAS